MQTVTLVLVTQVPQGAHWLIRKQVPLHPLQRFGFVGQGLSLEPLPPCLKISLANYCMKRLTRSPCSGVYTHTQHEAKETASQCRTSSSPLWMSELLHGTPSVHRNPESWIPQQPKTKATLSQECRELWRWARVRLGQLLKLAVRYFKQGSCWGEVREPWVETS